MINTPATPETVRADENAHGRIADALVVVSCAYTSLATGERFGLLGRERAFYSRLWPRFGRVIFVSYGGPDDHAVAASLVDSMKGRVSCICNERAVDPAVFLAGVPDQVCRAVEGSRSVLVLTEQHWGGEVGVCIARALRASRVRTGLCARGGYHWTAFVAREQGTHSAAYSQSRQLEGELIHAADTVIGTTPAMIESLAMLHAAASDKFRLVPNYVLTDQPPAPFAGRDPGLILSAGRLHPQKRFELLIKAVAALPMPLRAAVRLLIVGEGQGESSLRDQDARLARSGPTIEFRPRLPHDELMGLMRRCAVYAQCSAYEGHPKTILEAMAEGCPTLVTDGPGVSDCVDHGTTGLVARADPPSLARSLEHLLTDRVDASRLGAEAAQRTRAQLGIDAVFPLYRQACADAMHAAGSAATMPAAVVRWDQPLLNLPPDAAAATWAASVHAYAKRLDPAARDVFLRGLADRTGPTPATHPSPQGAQRTLSKP